MCRGVDTDLRGNAVFIVRQIMILNGQDSVAFCHAIAGRHKQGTALMLVKARFYDVRVDNRPC